MTRGTVTFNSEEVDTAIAVYAMAKLGVWTPCTARVRRIFDTETGLLMATVVVSDPEPKPKPPEGENE